MARKTTANSAQMLDMNLGGVNNRLFVNLGGVNNRGERILFFGPNTNTNIIRNQNFDRIRIKIIFVFSESANTNMNNIRAQIFGRIRIRIVFGFRIVPDYEYE